MAILPVISDSTVSGKKFNVINKQLLDNQGINMYVL